jgi:hypothetical protein
MASIGCDSLAEIALDVTASQRWHRMLNLGRDGLRFDSLEEMVLSVRQVDKDEGDSFAALHSDRRAWQRRHWMLQLGRDGLGCDIGGDGANCDSLAEMVSDLTG